jgi:hypothetical protein
MTNEVEDRIKNFIATWDNTKDRANWSTCVLFLEMSIDLLKKVLENK